MKHKPLPLILAMSTLLFGLSALPGCGGSETETDTSSDVDGNQRRSLQPQKPQQARGTQQSGLAGINREWIQMLEDWTQTAKQAADLYATVTDDASAQAVTDELEALHRLVATEQGGWQPSQFGSTFDSDALLEEWEQADQAFEAQRTRLREERGRVINAARDGSDMMEAVYAFKH